jgi:hypothetical protein
MAAMRAFFACLAFVCAFAAGAAVAQSRTRVWDIQLGTPIAQLPQTEFVDPACGTNGGPPSLPLQAWADFARCPVEILTGLREIWFIYDDEWEYIARAQRDPFEIGRYSANSYYRQPIVTSLLIDDAGLVQGYRVVTDTRALIDLRMQAYLLFPIFKGMHSDGPWTCADLPTDARERPIDGVFVKSACQMMSERRYVKAEGRHLLKAGQDVRDKPRFLDQAVGDFESSARLEVYNLAAVRGAPCCPASARP